MTKVKDAGSIQSWWRKLFSAEPTTFRDYMDFICSSYEQSKTAQTVGLVDGVRAAIRLYDASMWDPTAPTKCFPQPLPSVPQQAPRFLRPDLGKALVFFGATQLTTQERTMWETVQEACRQYDSNWANYCSDRENREKAGTDWRSDTAPLPRIVMPDEVVPQHDSSTQQKGAVEIKVFPKLITRLNNYPPGVRAFAYSFWIMQVLMFLSLMLTGITHQGDPRQGEDALIIYFFWFLLDGVYAVIWAFVRPPRSPR